MAGKLRSILSRIHWSLVVKAAVFGLAWLMLPYWLFFILGLFLYFIPTAQAKSMAGPFFVTLILGAFAGKGPFFALAFAILFYVILSVKGLLIVDRRSAYEAAVLFLFFLILRTLYIKVGGMLDGASLFGASLVGFAFGILMGSFLACFDANEGRIGLRRAISWVSALIVFELAVAGLVLPLDFTYQSVIVFLFAAVIIDLLPEYFFGDLSREKVLTATSIVFAFLAVILASARWSL